MENINIRGHFRLREKKNGNVVFEDHNLVVYGGYDAIAAIVGAAAGDETPEGSFQVRLFSGGTNSFSRSDTSITGTLQASAGISSYSLDTDKHSVILNYEVSASSFNGTTTLTTAGLYWNGNLFSEVDLDSLEHAANTEYVGTWEIIFGDDTIPVGDGTSSSPYLIANATQLDWFRSQVNAGNSSIHGALISGITYNQGKDVAGWDGKSGNSFTSSIPICTASGGYKGTFDGRGNTISGLFIDTSEYTRAGLFGYIGSGGVVKDVVMTNYYIATSYVGASTLHAGSVCGTMNSGASVSGCSCNGTVDIAADCSSSETIADAYVGGIVGYASSGSNYVKNCTFSGTVYESGKVGRVRSGGIVGDSFCDITGCVMSGTVDINGKLSLDSTDVRVGGICGYIEGSSTTSSNTMSGSVDVSGTSTTSIYCGGIVGINGSTAYVYENSLYGSYACTGRYGTTLYLNAIVGGGTTSSTYVYDNYDYTADSVSAVALAAAATTDDSDSIDTFEEGTATEVVSE